MEKHYKSVFDNEQELLKALIDIHCPWGIEIDPMYFKGNFYKEIERPGYYYDINSDLCDDADKNKPSCGDATNLHWFVDESFNSIILDPPFMFGGHGKQAEFYSSKTHGMLSWDELQQLYKGILKEACRLLTKKGILIFKCQDYTDAKTTITHSLVYNWATEMGFYAKDLAILVKPNKVYNPNTKQRHLRKIHTYFWVFRKNSLTPKASIKRVCTICTHP